MSGTVATDFYLWAIYESGHQVKQSFVNGWVRCLDTLTEAVGPVSDDTEDADALTRAIWECRYTIHFWAKAWGLALPSELSGAPAPGALAFASSPEVNTQVD